MRLTARDRLVLEDYGYVGMARPTAKSLSGIIAGLAGEVRQLIRDGLEDVAYDYAREAAHWARAMRRGHHA